MGDFVAGLKYGVSGFGLLNRAGVRLYVLIPLLINVLLFAAMPKKHFRLNFWPKMTATFN